MRYYPGPAGMHGGWFIYGLIGLVGTLVVLGLITWLVVFLVRRAKSPTIGETAQPPTASALHLLDERLARGDIEIDDYNARKAALTSGIAVAPGTAKPVAEPDPSV